MATGQLFLRGKLNAILNILEKTCSLRMRKHTFLFSFLRTLKAQYIYRSRNASRKNDKNHSDPNFSKYTLPTLFICKSHNCHDLENLGITSMHNIPSYLSFSTALCSEFCDPQQMEGSQKSQSLLQQEPAFQGGGLMKACFDRISS